MGLSERRGRPSAGHKSTDVSLKHAAIARGRAVVQDRGKRMLAKMFNRDRAAPVAPITPPAKEHVHVTPAVEATLAVPRGGLSYAEHASRLVRWCQDHGHVGVVEARDLERAIYPAMCSELRWYREAWPRVSPHIRRLLGNTRNTTRYIRGGYRICYVVPMANKPDLPPPRLPHLPKAAAPDPEFAAEYPPPIKRA